MTKRYLIMGANGGVGEHLAIRLAQAGFDVVATMRHHDGASESLRSHVHDIRAVDVTNISVMIDHLKDITQLGPLAGFAYCIGSIDLSSFKSATREHFLRAYEVNVLGAVTSLQVLEPSLKAGQGSVVLFSSIAAGTGFSNHSVIGSSKAAIEGLTKALAAEWAGQIRVNAIAPSLTETAMAKPLIASQPMRQAIEKMHPIARLGQPQDLASLAAFLLSEESSWITGQILHVDGGRSTLAGKG